MFAEGDTKGHQVALLLQLIESSSQFRTKIQNRSRLQKIKWGHLPCYGNEIFSFAQTFFILRAWLGS